MLRFLSGYEQAPLWPRATTRLLCSALSACSLAVVLSVSGCSEDSEPGIRDTDEPSKPAPSDDDDETTTAKPNPSIDGGGGGIKDAGRPPAKDAGAGDASARDSGVVVGLDAGKDAAVPPTGNDAATPAVDAATVADAAVVDAAVVLPTLGECVGGGREPCGTFVTRTGAKIPLGPYGAVMEPNVGKGFENPINSSDNELSCSLFASLFGQDRESTAELLDLKDLDLRLYTVYRPARWVEGETYPIVSWGNGTCAQPEGYSALLRYVASQGFVVVAANSRYVGSGEAQRRAIDFAVKANSDAASPYYGKLDVTKVAAMGHSQGGQGTVAAASDARIKSVILFNGGTTASKPFLGISGDRDIGSPTASTYATAVNRAPKAAFMFFHKIPGTGSSDGHLTLMTQPERVIDSTTQWLKLTLLDDAASKEWFVGASCKLCGNDADYEFGQKGL